MIYAFVDILGLLLVRMFIRCGADGGCMKVCLGGLGPIRHG